MSATQRTSLPLIDEDGFAARIADNFPPGWASNDAAYTVSGALYNILAMIGVPLHFQLGESLQYALDAMRIDTATDGALDLASLDFFGAAPESQFALPRDPGESDPGFSARILGGLLPSGATREAVTDAVTLVTGAVPRVIEPWSPSDTGVWDGAAGEGMMFWDVDDVTTPFRWTNPGLGYQGFIEFAIPPAASFGPTPTPCYDAPTVFYWDVLTARGAWLIDPTPSSFVGVDQVYAAINRTKVFGTIVWVKTTNTVTSPGDLTWLDLQSYYPGALSLNGGVVMVLPGVVPAVDSSIPAGWPVSNGGVLQISALGSSFGSPQWTLRVPTMLPSSSGLVWLNGLVFMVS